MVLKISILCSSYETKSRRLRRKLLQLFEDSLRAKLRGGYIIRLASLNKDNERSDELLRGDVPASGRAVDADR